MDTPTLAKMGISNPDEISRYTLRQRSPRSDVLKIYYTREKKSLLPVSRTYRFGRALKSSVADSGEPRFEETYEVSPELLSAVEELDALLGERLADRGPVAAVVDELHELGERLRRGEDTDPMELANRIDRLRDRLVRLSSEGS